MYVYIYIRTYIHTYIHTYSTLTLDPSRGGLRDAAGEGFPLAAELQRLALYFNRRYL